MRLVVALGGNALLRRGEPPTVDSQRRNAATAAEALVPLAAEHDLVVTHGNGPQVGLLAAQATNDTTFDILDAETEGMIGYLIAQELGNRLPQGRSCVSLLTQVEVDPDDPAFQAPTKPIGPISEDGVSRRLIASPRPQAILEIDVIRLLVERSVVVICAGGGGIPVVRRADGSHFGIEAVIDKDLSSALLARELGADFLLMLTDVDAVYDDWGTPGQQPISQIQADALDPNDFAPGSMRPKIEAAKEFGNAGIGRLEDAAAILAGSAGTRITP
jgi:carbamate kinase